MTTPTTIFTGDSGLATLLKDLGGGTGVTVSSAQKQKKKKSDHFFLTRSHSRQSADSAPQPGRVSPPALHHSITQQDKLPAVCLKLVTLVGVQQDHWRCRLDLTTCLSFACPLRLMNCGQCCAFQTSQETQSLLPHCCNSYFPSWKHLGIEDKC